jgi:hypothetical protein
MATNHVNNEEACTAKMGTAAAPVNDEYVPVCALWCNTQGRYQLLLMAVLLN